MAFLERAGARIHYQDSGTGPAVVFSHGLFMDRTMFDEQIAALGDYRSIAWDQRGHGESEAEGSYSFWDSAEDLIGVLDHLGIDQALLAGMSQGGFVSLRAALKAPERVSGLFLLDTQAGGEDPNVVPIYEAMAQDWITNGPSPELAGAVADIILGPADHKRWVDEWMARPNDYVMEPFRCLVDRDDLTDRLVEIKAPALVVHGAEDAAIPMELAEALCAGLEKCEGLVSIAGAGHASNLSHPREVNKVLIDFVARHAV